MRQLVEWIYVSVCLCLGKGEKGASESPVFDSRRSRKVKGREGGGCKKRLVKVEVYIFGVYCVVITACSECLFLFPRHEFTLDGSSFPSSRWQFSRISTKRGRGGVMEKGFSSFNRRYHSP